ncbi:MAG: D-ribose-binding periplasmic protein precursor [Pseudomonadota bacterium]
MKRLLLLASVVSIGLLGTVISTGCKKPPSSSSPRLAFITNGVASFWTIAKYGAEAAGQQLGVSVSVHMPAEGLVDQKRIVEDLITRGVDGIAISVIDANNQASFLNETSEKTNLITQDSDAPSTRRLAYVGMDNYKAGRMLGALIKDTLPKGGKLALFVGRVEQDNARKRRQGAIDEVLNRSFDSSRYDPPGTELTDGTYTFVVTLTDQFDRVKAKANCEDALLRYPDLTGVVGLFAYNAPLCLEALKQTQKLHAIKVFSFDEADETLQGIKDGSVTGTIVQNPYEYGFQSMKLLKDIVSGNTAAIPQDKFIDIPARRIDSSNIDAFWADLKKKTGKQ